LIRTTPKTATRAIAIFVAIVAFAVRFYWDVEIQNPLNAIDSDQAGYYNRACDLIDGVTRGDPRLYAFSPWGAHFITAVELWVVGKKNFIGIAAFHAAATTVPAVCCVSLTSRVTRSRFFLLLAGLLGAFWGPAIAHGGFFMSENWYAPLITAGTVFFLRFLEGKREPIRAGLCLGLAAIVRPQILLTFAIAGTLLIAIAWFRPSRAPFRGRTGFRQWALFFAPVAIILAISAVHMKQTAGHWGLVSENGALNKIWASTHLGKVQANWVYEGQTLAYWYSPSPKYPAKPEDSAVIEGRFGDEELVDRLRLEHEKRDTWARRQARRWWAVRLLVYQLPVPEDGYSYSDKEHKAFRLKIANAFRKVVLQGLPFFAIGLASMFLTRRGYLMGVVIFSHAVTMIYAAAVYLGEGRFRVPYDAFLITCGVAALVFLTRIVERAIREQVARLKRRPATFRA
jgi:hypothetical protein